MNFKEAADVILGEISRVVAGVSPQDVEVLAATINGAARVFVTGEGRSGLVGRAFAARLSQMGLAAFVTGETTMPPVGEGDLLVAVSGSGETPVTCHFAGVARAAGAKVAAVLCDGNSRLARLSDTVLVIPGKVKTGAGVDSVQMPGSLFEQAGFVVLDAAVMVLQEMRGESHESMTRRHTNLE